MPNLNTFLRIYLFPCQNITKYPKARERWALKTFAQSESYKLKLFTVYSFLLAAAAAALDLLRNESF